MVEVQIGKRIQSIRKQKGLTQEKPAEALGISTNHMSALERGIYSVMVDLLVQIMNILDCTAGNLFCDVIKNGYKQKASRLSDRLEALSPQDRKRIFDVVEVMIRSSKLSVRQKSSRYFVSFSFSTGCMGFRQASCFILIAGQSHWLKYS